MTEPIQILIADDHTLFRDGLRALFGSLQETAVVGEASSGQEAISLAESLQPDVVLMDIQMPDINGIDATRQIVKTSPHIGVIMLTMFEDDNSVFSAMRAGARGYVLKGAEQAELWRTISAVARGEALFSAAIALRLQKFFDVAQQAGVPLALADLTERERTVLHLLTQGHKNQEIARHLKISPKTVRNHCSNIFSKLQVTDRAQAIIKARDAGLG